MDAISANILPISSTQVVAVLAQIIKSEDFKTSCVHSKVPVQQSQECVMHHECLYGLGTMFERKQCFFQVLKVELSHLVTVMNQTLVTWCG